MVVVKREEIEKGCMLTESFKNELRKFWFLINRKGIYKKKIMYVKNKFQA